MRVGRETKILSGRGNGSRLRKEKGEKTAIFFVTNAYALQVTLWLPPSFLRLVSGIVWQPSLGDRRHFSFRASEFIVCVGQRRAIGNEREGGGSNIQENIKCGKIGGGTKGH